MSKTNKNIKKYLGYKFYKEKEDDSIELIRLIHISEFNDKVVIMNEESKIKKEIPFDSLKGYTPLIPYGKISFAKVKIYENGDKNKFVQDVIVAGYRDIDLKLEIYDPFVVARQNITDFWYNLLADSEDHMEVGASVTRENCPTNIPYAMMMACDEPINYEMVSIYIDDTVDSILNCITIDTYNKTFKKLFDDHMKFLNPMYDPSIPTDITNKNGWCKDLSTFLKINNFQKDIDDMRNITAYDFNLEEFMYQKESDPDIWFFNKDVLNFFNATNNLNASECTAIKYDYDIDLGEFRNTNYTLIRDNTDQLYIVVFTLSGEHLEKDLSDEVNKLSVSDKLRLDFYNKYHDTENM